MLRITRAVCVVAVASCLLPAQTKIAPDLKAASGTSANVLIRWAVAPGTTQRNFVKNNGGVLKRANARSRADQYTVPAAALATLAASSDIAYIAPDRGVKGTLDYATPVAGGELARAAGWTGTGVGVAVIDSGITPILDLSNGKTSRIVYAESFVPGVTSTLDDNGHGTHVAGIIGGNGASSTGSNYTKTIYGLAPTVDLINLKVLAADGSGTDSSVIAAIERAIALKSTYNIRVINLSIGRPVRESYKLDPLCAAVEAAWANGIAVVVAAGNMGRDNTAGTDGYGTILAPGNDPYVITVGAMKTVSTLAREDDAIASYSSKGPSVVDHVVKPDLVAPGNLMISTLDPSGTLTTTYPDNTVPLSY